MPRLPPALRARSDRYAGHRRHAALRAGRLQLTTMAIGMGRRSLPFIGEAVASPSVGRNRKAEGRGGAPRFESEEV